MDNINKISCEQTADMLKRHSEEELHYILSLLGLPMTFLLKEAHRQAVCHEKKYKNDVENLKRMEEHLGIHRNSDIFNSSNHINSDISSVDCN